jgi:RNA polymerase sigma-70 factor (ECF subfamily)
LENSGISEDDLVCRAVTDREALGRLYDLYLDRIFRFCSYRLPTRETAEEVTSEIFLHLAAGIRTFKGRTQKEFCSWLYTLANNQINTYFRKNSRRDILLNHAIQSQALNRPEAPAAEEKLDWPILHRAICGLKPEYQSVVSLRFFEGLTHEQIAEILHCRNGRVRVMLARALSRLRRSLNSAFNEGGK